MAIAYSFDSAIDSHPNGPSSTTLQYFRTPYADQVQGAFEPLSKANIDTAIVQIGDADLSAYRLVVVPADYLMDPESAKALRAYVRNGGTVILTAFSAKVDEHGLWFDTPLPGGLADVFGLKTNAFYNASSVHFTLDGNATDSPTQVYEILEPSTTMMLANFENAAERLPALTLNHFGKGNAMYFAAESRSAAMGPVLAYAARLAGVHPGPKSTDGGYARVVDGRTFYVNTTGLEKSVPIDGARIGLVSNWSYQDRIVLPPLAADLIP